MVGDKTVSKEIVGKTIVSKSGKKFGMVGDIIFESRTGELIYLLLKQPTQHAGSLDLEKNKAGNVMVPFSSVMAIGDFVVISEEDMV